MSIFIVKTKGGEWQSELNKEISNLFNTYRAKNIEMIELSASDLELIAKGLGHIENQLYDIIPTSQQSNKAKALLKKLESLA